jgi:preprotein translocase subunit SecY
VQQAFVGNDDTTLAWLKVIGLIVGLILLTIGAIYVLDIVITNKCLLHKLDN